MFKEKGCSGLKETGVFVWSALSLVWAGKGGGGNGRVTAVGRCRGIF